MSVNGDASEQVVRLSLESIEVLVKLTGSGAKNVAAMIYTIMKDKKQTKGKTKLNNMLKAGKPLKIFTIKKEDLKTFTKEAKNYGIAYCALVGRNNKDLDGMVDIMVKEEDASRINRIVERYKLTTTDTTKVKTEVNSEKNFNLAKTEKTPLSEPFLMTSEMQEGVSKETKKPSIKKELASLKIKAKKLDELKTKEKSNSKKFQKNNKVVKTNR